MEENWKQRLARRGQKEKPDVRSKSGAGCTGNVGGLSGEKILLMGMKHSCI